MVPSWVEVNDLHRVGWGWRGGERKHIKAAWNFISCLGLDSCVFETTFAIPGLALKCLRPALKLNLHQTVCKNVSGKVLKATFGGNSYRDV